MAVVTRFEEGKLQRPIRQRAMRATLSVFDLDGETFVQIDGYGSETKQLQGQRSQNLRMGREAALQLRDVIERTFG